MPDLSTLYLVLFILGITAGPLSALVALRAAVSARRDRRICEALARMSVTLMARDVLAHSGGLVSLPIPARLAEPIDPLTRFDLP